MPITNLIHLQSKCVAPGYLTYFSLPLPGTSAIDTARNKYLKTLGLPSNTLVRHILQASPKVHFSYVDTHDTIHAVHSLVPWSDPMGAHCFLVGAHTDSIQAEALMSVLAVAFNTSAISIAPKNILSLFPTWTDAALLPGNFTSVTDPASQVGSHPLHHNGSTNSISHFLLIPLLWPTTRDIPVDHPVDAPLPKGSYNGGHFTWLAVMQFLAAKNQAFSLHTFHTLFGAANWTTPGPGHNLLSQLCNDAAGLSLATTWFWPTNPSPNCHTVCLPFIDGTHLPHLHAVSSSLPNPLTTLPAPPTQNPSATNANIQDLVQALQQPTPNLGAQDAFAHSAWSWRIFLTQEYSDEVTGEYTIHPVTLPDASKAISQDKHAFGLTAAFNDEINCVAKQCHTNNVLPFVNITCDQFDRMFLHNVAHFVVMHTPLEQNSDILDSSLSIFNFLRIPRTNEEFRQRMHSARLYEAETLHIDEATHRTHQSATTLFVDRSQMTYSNKLIPGHNFLLFLRTLSHNAEHSLAILPFVVLARNPKLLHHAKHNTILPPKGFWLANSAFPIQLQLVEQAAYGNHLNPFTSAPTDARKAALATPAGEHDSKCQRRNTQAPANTPQTRKLKKIPPVPVTPPTTKPTGKASLSSKPSLPDPASTTHASFSMPLPGPDCLPMTKKLVTAYIDANPVVEFSPSSGARPTQAYYPFVHATPFLSVPNTAAWLRTYRPTCLYATLHAKYYHLDYTPARVNKVCCIFTTGPPKVCKGFSSDTNFWRYYHYDNHTSTESTLSKLCKVHIKDSRHGNTILKSHQIFDTCIRITPGSSCINNWTNKANKALVTFPGSFQNFLTHVWSLCISKLNPCWVHSSKYILWVSLTPCDHHQQVKPFWLSQS
eukprot:jgi/Psemu1/10956/gm1.10956_g